MIYDIKTFPESIANVISMTDVRVSVGHGRVHHHLLQQWP